MYEVHAFFAEGEATKAMEPEYEAGERYVLIVFCRRPRHSVHDFGLVKEIARRFGWEDVQVSHGGVLQPEFLNGELSDLQDSLAQGRRGGVAERLADAGALRPLKPARCFDAGTSTKVILWLNTPLFTLEPAGPCQRGSRVCQCAKG